jgi:hypothetical protein
MNLLRENSILLQCGRPPTAMNGVVSGRKNSGFILSGLLRDTPPILAAPGTAYSLLREQVRGK